MQIEKIGKYRIVARLGQGGMASVFLCVAAGPLGFNKLLVLKLLKEDLSHDSDFLAMFINEARLAARLNHANVVHTYEVGVENGQHFLAMDYLDGQPLHAVLRKVTRERMPLDVHVRILADTLAGLHYAHTLCDFDGTPLDVVHRDVSPQNVFVTYDGQVKLVDFGIAKAAGAVSTTHSGVFKGKVAYVAPEQAGGDAVDARSDIFSVGIMLWEAIAASRFAVGESQTAILARRLSGKEPRIREVIPDAEPELVDACDRAMALEPDGRFPSAQDFRDALEAYLDRFSRRTGSREVGELMTRVFSDERERIRGIIDQQMKQMLRETAQALPLPSIELSPGLLDHTPTAVDGVRRAEALAAPIAFPAGDSAPGGASGSHGTLVGANLSAPPRRGNKNAAFIVAFGVVAVASLLGMILVLDLGRPDAPQAAGASPASASPDSGAAASELIELEITFPAAATAKLDGVTLSQNPFVAQVPRDASMHILEVDSPGFVTHRTRLSYDRDITLTIVLDEEGSPTASAAASAPPGPRPGGPRPASTGTGKKPLNIDEEDPYRK